MINIIKKHPKRTIFIGVSFLFMIIFFLISYLLKRFLNYSVITTKTSEEVQQIFIFNLSLENYCTIITTLGILIGGCWGLIQYDKNIRLRQQEKASEIAQKFANDLIERIALISYTLMPNHEINKMFDKIVNSKQLNQFTKIEIVHILQDKECFEKYEKIIHSKRTQKRYNRLLAKMYNKSERNKFKSYFPLLVETTLNDLEAICINISSKAAGSQFIYDSLHQSFLNVVEILAVKISSQNDNNVDKYYTNIIAVYNMWNKQKNEDIEKLNKTQLKIQKLSTKAQDEINKLLYKKSKTV